MTRRGTSGAELCRYYRTYCELFQTTLDDEILPLDGWPVPHVPYTPRATQEDQWAWNAKRLRRMEHRASVGSNLWEDE